MRSHLKECPRSKQQQQRLSVSMERLDQHQQQQHLQQDPHRVQLLEQDIATMRSVLNEEIRQRLHLITDVGNIRKHNQVVEDWTRDTDECLAELRRLLGAETAQREYAIDQTQGDFQYCCNLTQVSGYTIHNGYPVIIGTYVCVCVVAKGSSGIEAGRHAAAHQSALGRCEFPSESTQ